MFNQIGLIVVGILILIGSFFFFPPKLNTKNLVKVALLIGLGVLLGMNGFKVAVPLLGPNSFEIKFDTVPIFLSGIWFGPAVGVLSGLLIDLIQLMVAPVAAPYLGFTLNLMVIGLIAGLVVKSKWNYKFINLILMLILLVVSCFIAFDQPKYLWLILLSMGGVAYLYYTKANPTIVFMVIVCEILVQMLATSLWLVDLLQLDFRLLLIPRLLEAPIMIWLHVAIVEVLTKIRSKK